MRNKFKRYCKILELIDDPKLIKEYTKLHARDAVWPEITAGMKDVGIINIENYALDPFLFNLIPCYFYITVIQVYCFNMSGSEFLMDIDSLHPVPASHFKQCLAFNRGQKRHAVIGQVCLGVNEAIIGVNIIRIMQHCILLIQLKQCLVH